MNTANRTRFLYIILFAVCSLGAVLNTCGQGRFIQNAGQWDSSIAARAGISGGTIFLCKDQIRYNFVNSKDVEVLHANPYCTDTVAVRGQAFFMKWVNANPTVSTGLSNQYPEYYNYIIGNNPSHWAGHVHAYSDFAYTNIYKGINLAMNAEGSVLEYTYEIAPGANPSTIQIKISGAEGVYIQGSDLHISSPLAQIVEKAPVAYQYNGDIKISVACNFSLSAGNIESFVFPNGYDSTKALIIDPQVIFATYSGSTADNFGFTATYDAAGDGYSGGDVFAAGFPTTSGAYQVNFAGGTNYSILPTDPGYIDLQVLGLFERDCGILKYTPDGKNLIYATYLGGKAGNEQPHSMIVDKSNNLVVMGTTASKDFPVTAHAYSSKMQGKTDLFVSRLSADGSKLLASTFMGGSNFDGLNGLDSIYEWDSIGYIWAYLKPYATTKLLYNYGDQFRGEVVTDTSNGIYVVSSTMSTNFPTTSGSFQSKFGGGRQDGVAFKLDSNLHQLIWSTYIGGNKDDAAYSVQLSPDKSAFICGGTLSPYFFPNGPSFQNALAGDVDGYICHLKPDGSGIVRATYWGTAKYDQTYFVQLDNSQNVYVYGQTENNSFPVTHVKYANPSSGNFITKFNNGLDSIMFSSVFGSGKDLPDISPTAFLVDKCEKIYISGWGGELYYPSLSRLHKVYGMPITKDAYQPKTADSSDFYVAVFEKDMDTLLYSSYFGGPKSEEHVDGGTSRFDKNGVIYQSVCGGCGAHSDFPTTPGAWSRTNNSTNCNNLLFKVNLFIPSLKASAILPSFGCYNALVTFKNTSLDAKSYIWDFGDSSPVSNQTSPQHLYKQPGTYTVTLIAVNPNSCAVNDTFTKQITVYKQARPAMLVSRDSCSLKLNFAQTGQCNTVRWDFGDGGKSDSMKGVYPYAKQGSYLIRLIADSGTTCADTFTKRVVVEAVKADFSYRFDTCQSTLYQFKNLSTSNVKTHKWYFPYASTDTARNPVFDFLYPGSYTVSLTVSDSLGCSDSTSQHIQVIPKPKADFSFQVNTCTKQIYLKSQSISAGRLTWHFQDGSTSHADSLYYTFKNDTVITIKLVVDSGSACPDTMIKQIKTSPPRAAFTYYVDTCTGLVHFANTSIAEDSVSWKFDATDSSSANNPTFSFQKKGSYPVKLTVASPSGCLDSVTHVVTIDEDAGIKLFIPNVFTPNGDDYNKTFQVQGLNKCYVYDISIYNRWGQLYYHGEGNHLGWNGYYNHVLVPEGEYYYVFHGKLEGELKGIITVLY